MHYKSDVLSFLEYRTCAITHAADVHLNSLNGVQKRFLRNIDISSFDALRSFNLAPLSIRRDMANLGIIYRALLRQGPRQLQALFRFDARERRTSPRWQVHQYQVLDETRCLNCDFLNRSTFGYVAVFNLLPSVVFHSVEFDSPIPVKEFQKNLNNLVKYVSHDLDTWEFMYSPRFPLHCHSLINFRNLDSIPHISR